jgi:hypothetical protein
MKSIAGYLLFSAGLIGLLANNSPTLAADVVINSDTIWASGTYTIGNLTVTNGAKLTLRGRNTSGRVDGQWQGHGVTIVALNVQIDEGSSINADAQGYTGGATGQPGNGPGGGCGSSLYDSAGGSYGGSGYGTTTCSSGPTYGSALEPGDLGSGAGGTTTCAGGTCYADRVGGNGGGAIRLIISDTLTNNGTISANGGSGPANWPPGLDTYAGGGSGGSIWATVGALAGAGIFAANGAPRYWNQEPTVPSGGGGRIAVYYGEGSSFSGFDASSANGGPSSEQGTVAFIDTGRNELLVTGGQRLIFDQDSSVAFHGITVRGGADLIVGGNSTITAPGSIRITGNSRIILGGKNTEARVDDQWIGQGVTVQAGDVQVDSGSAISADEQGYTGGATGQPGNGPGGGCGSAMYDSAGGSHGGPGNGIPTCESGPTYGSPDNPIDLGSGGGGTTTCAGGVCYAALVGGNGGGAIRLIVTGTLTNDGVISANGGNGLALWSPSLDGYAGGGSGGSIWATIRHLTGSGAFTASGGSRYWGELPAALGGGGGRIAIYYVTENYEPGLLSVDGGIGGQHGSVLFDVLPGIQVTIAANPAGRSFTVDGQTFTNSTAFTWEFGSEHTIGVASPQTGSAGIQYVFRCWSDGGTQSHSAITPAVRSTYTANFGIRFLRNGRLAGRPQINRRSSGFDERRIRRDRSR